MNDLKELGKLMKEHPIIIVVTLAAMAVGAILGAVVRLNFAFYTEMQIEGQFRSCPKRTG